MKLLDILKEENQPERPSPEEEEKQIKRAERIFQGLSKGTIIAQTIRNGDHPLKYHLEGPLSFKWQEDSFHNRYMLILCFHKVTFYTKNPEFYQLCIEKHKLMPGSTAHTVQESIISNDLFGHLNDLFWNFKIKIRFDKLKDINFVLDTD